MSSRQDDHMDDAEFDAEFAGFLRGEGELAGLLRQVPQPEPSSELDRKILADAQVALAQPASANDAVLPEGERQPPELRSTSGDISRFIRRARAPLGLAATIVIAVSLGVQWYEEPEVAKQVTVPAVPELKTGLPPSTQSADMPAPAEDAAAAAPLKQEALPRVPKPAKTVQPPRKKEAPEDMAEARLQEAPAPAPAAAPVTSVAPMPPTAPIAAPAPAGAVADGAPESRKPMAISPPPRAIAAVPSVMPVAPKAAAPQASFAYSRAPEPGTLSKQAVLPTADAQGIAPAEDPKAREWLQKIDDLIKQGRNAEALRSWEDFRKAYPDYAVPEPLKAKLKALAP